MTSEVDEGSKGDEIAIQPIGNALDDQEPERLLEGLGVCLVDPRETPLGWWWILEMKRHGKCLNKGTRECLSLRSDILKKGGGSEREEKRRVLHLVIKMRMLSLM